MGLGLNYMYLKFYLNCQLLHQFASEKLPQDLNFHPKLESPWYLRVLSDTSMIVYNQNESECCLAMLVHELGDKWITLVHWLWRVITSLTFWKVKTLLHTLTSHHFTSFFSFLGFTFNNCSYFVRHFYFFLQIIFFKLNFLKYLKFYCRRNKFYLKF